MANPALETVVRPFTAFNFVVDIAVPDFPGSLCSGAFAECDGLELTMDVKSVREGGNNAAQLRLFGALNTGTLTLKRGMTGTFDLWKWFGKLYEPGRARSRGTVTVTLLAADRSEQARFVLTGCLPLKLKAPPLNAKDGLVAIEELQIAYESLRLVTPGS